jgi:hypothetical protein
LYCKTKALFSKIIKKEARMDDQVERDDKGYWFTATHLPEEVFQVWVKPNKAISPVAVLATIDPDGKPRTAPFGSLRAVTPRLLRLCSMRYHDTCANLIRDGRVSVLLISPPDVAVSASGRARMVRDEMETDRDFAVFEIDIESVKNDMADRIVIDSGIDIRAKAEFKHWYDEAMEELAQVS